MTVLLVTVILFGTVFGFLQASLDPESHKSSLAMMFFLKIEIKDSLPIGAIIGMIFGFIVEYLRQ